MKASSLGQKTRHATATLYLVPARAGRIVEGRRLAGMVVGETERDQDLAARGAHPDVIELLPPEGKERVGIGSVREAVRAGQFAPAQGDRKVCLIPKAEALTVEAANALLKTLEEPPREMAFVLLAEHTADLLPTIVSRSRLVRLETSAPRELRRRLLEVGYTDAQATWLAAIANRDGETDRFTDALLDLDALATAAEEHVESLPPQELAATCTEGESILRHAALTHLLDRSVSRDPDLLTAGVRFFAQQSREALFTFLHDLLDAAFERVRETESEPDATPADAARDRLACRAIETAYRALSVYSPPEAVLLSLFLSIGGAADGR